MVARNLLASRKKPAGPAITAVAAMAVLPDLLTSRLRTLFKSFIFCLFFLPSIGFSQSIENEDLIPEILPAEQAFQLDAKAHDPGIKLQITIAPGYMLYHEHLLFNLLPLSPTTNSVGNTPVSIPVSLPNAIKKQDPVLGDYLIYKGKLELDIALPAETLKQSDLLISYQGCSDGGFCYAPEAKQIHVYQDGTQLLTQVSRIDPDKLISSPKIKQTSDTPKEHDSLSESDRLTQVLHSQKPWITLLLFLGVGLLLAFTPCVLPMLPILANILVGPDKPLATRRAIFLASLYILSIAFCYGMAGVIAGLAGQHWQATLQQPPFLIAFSILLILFALNQFNLLTLRLPAFLTNAFGRIPGIQGIQLKPKQGSAVGAMSMGVMSALVASPCVTPALVGALTYISQTGNALLGGLALFMMSLGMGLPLLGVACVGNRLLPKTGAWMNRIKTITGILLLVLAATILWRAMPTQTTEFLNIESPEQLTHVLENAKKLKKPVILDVYAQWCVSCKRMDHAIFDPQQTKSLNAEYHLLRLDITKLGKGHKQLLTELGIIGPPTVLFFDMQGQELKNLRLVGEINKPDFVNHMHRFKKTLSLSQAP